MVVRRLSWPVFAFCVACGKLAGFDDLKGEDESGESGAAGDVQSGTKGGAGGSASGSGGNGGTSGNGGNGGTGGSAGTGAGATGGSSDGEGGSGESPGTGGAGGSAGSAASGGVSGAGGAGSGGSGGTAGSGETGGSGGATAGTSGATGNGGAAGTAAGAGGMGGAGGTSGAAGTSGANGGGAGIGNPSGCGELLTNGGFEDGRLGWDVMTSYPNLELNVHAAIVERNDEALLALGVTPYAGDFVGWAGGVPDSNRNHSLFVTQPIVISENVTELTFSGFFRIETDEPTDTFYDALYIEVLDTEYERVWQFGALSNEHAGPWFALDPIDPYFEDLDLVRGGQFYLGVYSRTDSNTVTHFFFDSLSLVATCE